MGYGKAVKWESTLSVLPVSWLSSWLLLHINITLADLLNFGFINLGFIFDKMSDFNMSEEKKNFHLR